MTPSLCIGFACELAAFLIAAYFVCEFITSAKQKAYEKGKQDGQAETDKWWIERVSVEVDLTRQQIWREEPKTGAGWP
jgi:hypothetical protein